MTGFNIWNYTLNESDIKDIADCHSWPKGNIVGWEKNNMKSRNVLFNPLLDTSSLCVKEKEYFIFPEKVLYSTAHDPCAVHGGKVVVPESMEESKKILNIVNKHKEQCSDPFNENFGSPIWLGVKKLK